MLHHPDFKAAANTEESSRSFEIFSDASDYGWAAVLCQRLEIIALIAKAFQDVQLRWSAMERELYALWQGVVGHERLIKGFTVFATRTTKTFCLARPSWVIGGEVRR